MQKLVLFSPADTRLWSTHSSHDQTSRNRKGKAKVNIVDAAVLSLRSFAENAEDRLLPSSSTFKATNPTP